MEYLVYDLFERFVGSTPYESEAEAMANACGGFYLDGETLEDIYESEE